MKKHRAERKGKEALRDVTLPFRSGLLCIQVGGAAQLEGCGPVLAFDENRLTVETGTTLINFYGSELTIEAFGQKRMRIRGSLQRVEFESKREKP